MPDPTPDSPSLVLRLKRLVLRAIVFFRRGGTVTTADGLRFTVFDDWIMGRVILHKAYEKGWTDRVRPLIREGDTCVDVGANFGYYSVLLATLAGSGGRVIAVEPNPRLAPVLARNFELNDVTARVELHRVGVGRAAGRARMGGAEATTGLGYIVEGEGDIPVTTLDALAGDRAGRIAFLKIDIEGGEADALAGAGAILAADSPPLILCEHNPAAAARNPGAETVPQILARHGYAVLLPGGGTAPAADWDRLGLPPGNFLAVPGRGAFAARAAGDGGTPA